MTLGYAEEIKFGTLNLDLITINRKKVPGTIKQQVGGKLIKHNIPGRSTREWEVSGNGIIYDKATAATTARNALEEAFDLEPRVYQDGHIVATMVMESLTFADTGDNPLSYRYTIKFIEFSQAD